MKEKKKEEDNSKEQENNEFYYELIGIISILLSIVVFSELGTVGEGLKIFLKIFFGEWYFLIVLLSFIYGIMSLWKHKFIEFKDRRFVGIYLLIISLLILSHFPIKEYVGTRNENQIVGTWELFMEYLKNYDDSYMMAGGIIGAVFFYLFSFLFGDFGVYLLCMIVVITSLAFISNKSVREMYYSMKKLFKNTGGLAKKTKNYLKVKPKNNLKKSDSKKKLSISFLHDIDVSQNFKMQKKVSINKSKAIDSLLIREGINFNMESIEVGYQATRYIYKLNTDKISNIQNDLRRILTESSLIKVSNSKIIIEEKNKFRSMLALKKIMLEQKNFKKNLFIPLGFEISSEVLELDFDSVNTLFIQGSINETLVNVIRTLIITFYMKLKVNEFDILMFDKVNELTIFDKLSNVKIYNHDVSKFLAKVSKIIEERTEILNYLNVNNLNQFNDKIIKEKLDFKVMNVVFVMINNFELIYSKVLDNRLLYLTQLGDCCGVKLIVSNKSDVTMNNVLLNQFKYKLLFKCSKEISIPFINKRFGIYLFDKGDFILKVKENYLRGQVPYLSENETLKIINKLSKY